MSEKKQRQKKFLSQRDTIYQNKDEVRYETETRSGGSEAKYRSFKLRVGTRRTRSELKTHMERREHVHEAQTLEQSSESSSWDNSEGGGGEEAEDHFGDRSEPECNNQTTHNFLVL